MPAHKAPRFTPAEIAVLREHYPEGGVEAVHQHLPHRTWRSIYTKACKLGIHSNRKSACRKSALPPEHLEEAIRLREEQRWSFARIGEKFGVAEASACNAVLIALCSRKGFTPAQRDQFGRLTPEGLERVRYALKKGLKGVDIQLRLGVSAACVADQRRRYNRDLAERGKALLPPPGGGMRYSGVKVPRQQRAEVEALYMQGLGVLKIAARTGISKTTCTRIRERLVKRLKRKGECLPGCDIDGVRHVQAENSRHIHPSQIEAFRAMLLDRVPVLRASRLCAIGHCSAIRLRDELAAELAANGEELPTPIRPGRVKKGAYVDPFWPPEGARQIYTFRQLLDELPFEEAKACWRRDRAAERKAEAARPKTFEEQLALVATGKAKLATVAPRAHLEPTIAKGLQA